MGRVEANFMFNTSRFLAAAAVVLLLAIAATAEDDSHDKLVHGRFSPTLQPCRIQYPADEKAEKQMRELDHPATKQDVAEGKAVFSFEGLGQARVWRLPKCPLAAIWPDLKTPSDKTDAKLFDDADNGRVCQAEELLVDGYWKRYYGFVSRRGGAAVVPGERIELYLDDPDDGSYTQLASGIDCRLEVAAPWRRNEPSRRYPEPSAPLPVEIRLRNRLGADQQVPTAFYRDAKSGGPALLQGVTVSLRVAPYDPRILSPEYPWAANQYKPVAAKRETHFAPAANPSKRLLKTGESFEAFTFDLHDWFKIDEPGYYALTITFDEHQMGLISAPPAGDRHCVGRCFMIGEPPVRLTVAQLNRERNPLTVAAKARLTKLIQQTAKPSPPTPRSGLPNVDALLGWSKAAGGLMGRIEFVYRGRYADSQPDGGFTALVRLKNVADHPLKVPTANRADESGTDQQSHGPKSEPFELYTKPYGGDWQRVDWPLESCLTFWANPAMPFPTPPERPGLKRLCVSGPSAVRDRRGPNAADKVAGESVSSLLVPEPRFVTLKPGESCLISLGASDQPGPQVGNIRIILRQPDASDRRAWSGVLETPPHRSHVKADSLALLKGRLPFPEHFPELTEGMLAALDLYDPADVRRRLEEELREAIAPERRLLLAGLAAGFDSPEGALALLAAAEKTDYWSVSGFRDALEAASLRQRGHPSDWLVELIKLVASDERYLTGWDDPDGQKNPLVTLASFDPEYSGSVLDCLDKAQALQAISWLIGQAKYPDPTESFPWRRGSSRQEQAIGILGDMGDPRAIPALLDCVKRMGEVAPSGLEGSSSEYISAPLAALARLKSKDEVPLLVKHLDDWGVVDLLVEIGDQRALRALRQSPRPDAKLAVALLETGDAVPRLLQLLNDPSVKEYDRYKLIWQIGRHPDPRAIPALIHLIHTERDGHSVGPAIDALGNIQSTEAVAQLIDCFDARFKCKFETDVPDPCTPEILHGRIAAALRNLTDADITADKLQWRNWWNEVGKKNEKQK